jgi:phytoene dehydrogenase-like protein
LNLAAHGLRMVPCEPALQVPFPDGEVLPWWPEPEKTAAAIQRFSARDAQRFVNLDGELKKLARYLQAYFLEPPPDLEARGLSAIAELMRLGKRFRGISGREIGRLVAFLTGSLGELLDRSFESERVKTLVLANNIYGKHGGPYQPGSALGLLFHLLSGSEREQQGYFGHVMGGMGAITRAMAAEAQARGVEIRTESPVGRVEVRNGRVEGVVLEDGTLFRARTVLSNADPKRTFLGLLEPTTLPEDFLEAVRGIKMDGPCAKVNLVLAEEPRVRGIPAGAPPGERALFTLLPSLEFAERSYETARRGEIPEELWVDAVVASNVDPSLAPPGRHVMTCFVQYVPYRLRQSSWDQERERLGDRVVKKVAEYAPNVPGAILARQVLTPLDLERVFGLSEGNIFHGDLSLGQLLFMRPVPGWSQYRTPIGGLYLCGAGAHPGGGVTGAPGYNAAHQVLRDLKRRR